MTKTSATHLHEACCWLGIALFFLLVAAGLIQGLA